MQWSVVIFVFVFPALAPANEEILNGRQNASLSVDQTIVKSESSRRNEYDGSQRTQQDALPGPWVADMFHRALANFTIQKDVGTLECQKQTQMYIRHLKNNSYWAVKMYDSWSRYPNGILAGTTHQMGVYNECIDVHVPVQGKYCMSAIRLGAVDGRAFDVERKDEMESYDHAWNEILGFDNYEYRYRRNEMKIGICIPESCTAADLEMSLQNELDNVFLPRLVQSQVKVEPMLCSTDEHMYPYDTGYYFTRVMICLVFVICCLSTLIHLVKITWNTDTINKANLPDCVYWFSIIHNGRALIKYDKNNELNIFNGIKVLAMVMTLFAHKYLFYSMHPTSYAIVAEKLYQTGPDIILTGMNIVDPFFYITGFLMYVMIKKHFLKRGVAWIQIPMIIFYKYLRMMPAYGAMMLLTVYSIPYLYSGPFWASQMWPEAEKCKNYWWANFLAISNFIDVDNQCMIVGWYVSCLFQFLVIGTVIIYICVKNRKVGVALIIVLLCMSLIIPFVLTYVTGTYGLIRITLPFLENPSSSYEFRNVYRAFYTRGVPFYAGLLAGVVVEELQNKGFKMSKLVAFVWTFIITMISIWVQKYGVVFYERHRPYNVVEQAAYSTLSHCTWTAPLFCITVFYFISGYGPIEKVFNNRFMTVFGRLSFTVYLVNIPVIMIIESRQSTSVSPNIELWVDSWIVGTVRSYLMGLVLYLLVEGPFNIITKKMFFGSGNNSNRAKNKECAALDHRNPTKNENVPDDSRL